VQDVDCGKRAEEERDACNDGYLFKGNVCACEDPSGVADCVVREKMYDCHVLPYPLMIALRIAIDQMAMRPKQKLAMKSQLGLINI